MEESESVHFVCRQVATHAEIGSIGLKTPLAQMVSGTAAKTAPKITTMIAIKVTPNSLSVCL